MAIPDGNIDTSNADADGDSLAAFRVQALELINQFNALIASFGVADGAATLDADGKVPGLQLGRGVAGGVASLNAQGEIPATQIPDAQAASASSVDITEDGYLGSGDRIVTNFNAEFVPSATGVSLAITVTYAQAT